MVRWSKKELKVLGENYLAKEKEELVLELGRSWEEIQRKARELGLYKSKARVAEYNPAATEKMLKEFDEARKRLRRLMEKLEQMVEELDAKINGTGKITNRDLIALAKTVDSIRECAKDSAQYAKIIENSVTNIKSLTLNMNVLSLVQTANEVMTPEQRVQFMKSLKRKGVVEDLVIP